MILWGETLVPELAPLGGPYLPMWKVCVPNLWYGDSGGPLEVMAMGIIWAGRQGILQDLTPDVGQLELPQIPV